MVRRQSPDQSSTDLNRSTAALLRRIRARQAQQLELLRRPLHPAPPALSLERDTEAATSSRNSRAHAAAPTAR